MKLLAGALLILTLASAAVGCASSGTTESAASWAEKDRAWCERSGRTWRPAVGMCGFPGGGP